MLSFSAQRSNPSKPIRGIHGWTAFLALALGAGLGCESGSHGKDAAPTTSQQMAQVAVRMDLPSGGAPSVSVLAFRAEAVDVATADVLGAVDPLVVAAPESSCELRDVGGAARMMRTQGGSVNLQELSGVTLQVSADESLHPAPRVYPPLADVVGGVIAEAGPLDLGQLPEALTLAIATLKDERAAVRLSLPNAPSVSDSSETLLDAHTAMSMKGDLVLRVSGPPRTFLEIRPFGAPSAIACAVSSGGWVVVPHDLLTKLVATAGHAPVSFEAVWRENRTVQAGSETMRISFEARSSAVLELRP
jgi:hypothetical protein